MALRSRPLSTRCALIAATIACLAVTFAATAAPAAAVTFANTAPITMPDPNCTDPDTASPYPSNISVSGLTGTVSDVNVTLHGITHAFQGDLEVLLVGPAGGSQNLTLLSDAGTGSFSNATVTFDDAAPSQAPQNSVWAPGTYKPTNYTELSGADTFPAPAPAPSGDTTLAAAFNGIAPNGTWSLYVVDDACPDAGTIAGGWSLNVTTSAGAVTTTDVASSLNPSRTGQSVTFTASVQSSGSPVTTGTVTFSEGTTILASNVPLNGSGVAAFSTSALAQGNHHITATYNGTASFATSNDTVDQRVDNNTVVSGSQYCNTGPIAINDNGPATPYPSNIFVSGAPTALTKVTVTLRNVSHTFAGDIEVLLVGPAGQNLVAVSDAGTAGITNVTLTLDDAVAGVLPVSGSWAAPNATISAKPTNHIEAVADTFPPPAPAPSAATTLATFNGSNPNGTWQLYVKDDGAPDTGSIAGGWCLNLTAAPAVTASLPALVRTSTTWLLRESLSTGSADSAFTYGNRPLTPMMGDWNDDGLDTPGTFELGIFKLRNSNTTGTTPDVSFTFGDPRGFPVAGDFNGDGTDDVAVYRNGTWQVRLSTGTIVPSFTFGSGSWPATVPVAGDWDGDGTDGIGTYTYGSATWNLRNAASAGAPDIGPFVFGTPASSYPVTGDWDADGDDTVGVKTGATWSLRNTNSPGAADTTFDYGLANDLPLSWHKP